MSSAHTHKGGSHASSLVGSAPGRAGNDAAASSSVQSARKEKASSESVELLRKEIAELRASLATSREENVLLNDVISTIGSTLKLDEVLRHLVDTIVRAISCHAAFIYLYNKEKDSLVLASTSEQYQHQVGKIELALGEGITGWVALTLKPLILKDEAMEDPRFRYFPDLEEEKFQSTMTVPITGKDRHLIGVITMHAVAPYEFTDQHQTFVTNMASLAASAIENAQLYENTQHKLSILTSLSVLSQTISSGLYLDDMLRSLATLTVQIMEVDQCVIMLVDQARGHLTLRASSPNLNDRALNFQPIDVDRHVWEKLREISEAAWKEKDNSRSQLSEVNTSALERLNPLKDSQFKALLSAPLITGTEHLGLINCYSSQARRYTSEDQTLLSTIANQVAIAIKNSHLVDMLAQKNLVKGFFDDLKYGTYDSEESMRQRANFLGCDLAKPHLVALIEFAEDLPFDPAETQSRRASGVAGSPSKDLPFKPAEMQSGRAFTSHLSESRNADFAGEMDSKSTNGVAESHSRLDEENGNKDSQKAGGISASIYQTEDDRLAAHKRISGLIRRRIQDAYPGSVVYEHENLLTCVLCLSKDPNAIRMKTWLRDLSRLMRSEQKVHLSIGVGNTCQVISDYRRGFAEAGEALQMGQNLNREGGVTHFNDLGVYRYLYKIARMDDLRDIYQDQVARIANYDHRKGTDLLDTLEIYLECAGNLTKTSNRLFVHRNTLIQRLERLQSLCDIDLQERSNWLTLQVAIKVYKLRSNAS